VPLLLPKAGHTRSRLNAWLEPVEDQVCDFHGFGRDRNDQALRHGRTRRGGSWPDRIAGKKSPPAVWWRARLGRSPMVRQIGLIYRRDKALSKAALGFIEVTMSHAVTEAAALPKRPGL